jgi:hypothetical protein
LGWPPPELEGSAGALAHVREPVERRALFYRL